MKIFIISLTALMFMAASPAPASEGVMPMLDMETAYRFIFPGEFSPAALFFHVDFRFPSA